MIEKLFSMKNQSCASQIVNSVIVMLVNNVPAIIVNVVDLDNAFMTLVDNLLARYVIAIRMNTRMNSYTKETSVSFVFMVLYITNQSAFNIHADFVNSKIAF